MAGDVCPGDSREPAGSQPASSPELLLRDTAAIMCLGIRRGLLVAAGAELLSCSCPARGYIGAAADFELYAARLVVAFAALWCR